MQVCDIMYASFMWRWVYAAYKQKKSLSDINVYIWPGYLSVVYMNRVDQGGIWMPWNLLFSTF